MGNRLGRRASAALIPQFMLKLSPGASQRRPSPLLKALAGPVMGSMATALARPGNFVVTKTWT